jgi:restriction endonuclease S subunit
MRPSGNKIDDMKTDLVSAHTSIMASVNNFTSAVIRIRDILRKTAISGMESMRHICLYLMARQITRQTVLDLDIPIKFAWENIIEMMHTQEGGEQYALEFFYHQEEDCLVRHFDRLFGTEKFSFDIKNLKTHKEILEILDRIDLSMVDSQMDILGWVYEQHLKTGAGSGGRDLGQFFTDRTICEYMVSLCRPSFKRAGVPESVCDPSMGTGGFLTSFIKYYKKHHSDTPINWKIQQKEIHGCDNDPRVAGIARMNLFMETGGNRPTNLRTHDSLQGDLTQTGYDVILANEPFGLKGLKHADCCDRVKQLKIRGTKSEPLFLQLMMVSLNMGGRCAVVVPDGMLVNTSELHDGTRKYLLDHFELKRVIKMRGQFFMNTGIQPSILFFENTGNPTTTVEFWDVEKSKNGEIKETMVLSIPRDQLDASCSLDMRRYQEVKKVEKMAGYPMVKLGSVCDLLSGKGNYVQDGDTYPYYDSNGITGTRKDYLYDGEYVVTARKMSIGAVHYVSGKYWASDNTINLRVKPDSALSSRFLYYWLLLNNKVLKDLSSGIKPGIRKSDVEEIHMPLPPLPIQQEMVATLDRIYAPGTTELAETLKLTNQAMDLVLAQPNGATLEPIVETQRLMRKSAQMVADVNAQMVTDVKAQMVAIVKASMIGSICKKYVLSELANDNPDSIKQSDKFETINYVDLGSVKEGNITTIQNIPFAEKPSRAQRKIRDGDIIWGGVRPLSRSYAFIDRAVENMIGSSGFVVIRNKDINVVLSKYLYYILTTDDCVNYLNSHSTGTSYPAFNSTTIMAYEVVIPSIAIQTRTLERLDALQTQLTALENLGKQAEDNARFILESYLQSHTKSPYSSEAVWNSHEETLVNEVVEESSSAAASSSISAPHPLKMKKPAVSKK